jgi:pyruvate/2-oxoglutarate dehydrogenase complex dihydrolipoamide acyltransferase (E2) component
VSEEAKSQTDEPGELTLEDVEWLAEHSDLPDGVINTLTEVVRERDQAPDQQPDTNEVRASKFAIALAKEKGIELGEVKGTGQTGPEGRRTIKKSDVEEEIAKREASPQAPAGAQMTLGESLSS